ncbi:MAG: hypothetical protein U0836_23960 [Pirellulales bacterium]
MNACAECHSPLPLRDARDGECPQVWECAFCGQLYSGVLDENAPADQRRQVRRPDWLQQ